MTTRIRCIYGTSTYFFMVLGIHQEPRQRRQSTALYHRPKFSNIEDNARAFDESFIC